jgi:hypothetical protein
MNVRLTRAEMVLYALTPPTTLRSQSIAIAVRVLLGFMVLTALLTPTSAHLCRAEMAELASTHHQMSASPTTRTDVSALLDL